MVTVSWLLDIPENPRSLSNASSTITVMLSSLFLRSSLQGTPTLRSSLRPTGPDDKPRRKPRRSVTWSTHVEVWRQPSRSVSWSTHIEVFAIPARE